LYTPLQNCTDDYPNIELALVMKSSVALLFTKSQGEFHAPWGACVDGEVYIAAGEEIGRTLSSLCEPIQRPVFDRMIACEEV
jgi:hypothetical protein